MHYTCIIHSHLVEENKTKKWSTRFSVYINSPCSIPITWLTNVSRSNESILIENETKIKGKIDSKPKPNEAYRGTCPQTQILYDNMNVTRNNAITIHSVAFSFGNLMQYLMIKCDLGE